MTEIRVVLLGGTGNQFFQYAAGRHLALRHGADLVLDGYRLGRGYNRNYDLHRFRIAARAENLPGPMPDGARARHEARMRESGGPTFNGSPHRFDPEFLRLPGRCVLLGLFQCEAYFGPVAERIRAELAFKPFVIAPETAATARRIRETASVAVHVRRTDYVGNPRFHLCTPDYYRRAVARVRETAPGATFFFFSDDIGWCRETFAGEGFSFVDLPQSARDPLTDLWLMARCHHHVIANSTFSWWGAWLADRPGKIVVAPDRWLNEADVPIDEKLPQGWETMPVDAGGG